MVVTVFISCSQEFCLERKRNFVIERVPRLS